MQGDTICAAATAAGNAGVAVIRLSGPKTLPILQKISKGKAFAPRNMVFSRIYEEDTLLDEGLLVFFPGPASYTGEDCGEIHCHGGQVGVGLILRTLISLGARPAQPGEYTKRAFLNGKMDMTQAEAVQMHISALSEKGALTGAAHLSGALGRQIDSLQDRLTTVLAILEAGIQYPEDELEGTLAKEHIDTLKELEAGLRKLSGTFRQGKMLQEGLRLAIAGRPNVGKSSLLNAFLGQDRAIVTHLPGTTRDVLTEYFVYRSLPFVLMDTAGIRETEDLVESIGVKRSRAAIESCDFALFLLDSSCPITEEDEEVFRQIQEKPHLSVLNKSDMKPVCSAQEVRRVFGENPVVLSAKTGEGVEALLEALYARATEGADLEEGLLIANERQKYALDQAITALSEGIEALESGLDLDCASIDLHAAWDGLGQITGRALREDIIDRIFSTFCLGK